MGISYYWFYALGTFRYLRTFLYKIKKKYLNVNIFYEVNSNKYKLFAYLHFFKIMFNLQLNIEVFMNKFKN